MKSLSKNERFNLFYLCISNCHSNEGKFNAEKLNYSNVNTQWLLCHWNNFFRFSLIRLVFFNNFFNYDKFSLKIVGCRNCRCINDFDHRIMHKRSSAVLSRQLCSSLKRLVHVIYAMKQTTFWLFQCLPWFW